MKRKITACSKACLAMAVALGGGCKKDSDNQPTSPPPVTFTLSIASVRAAGGPDMTEDCLEVGRDPRGTVIVAVDGPPINPKYLNPPGQCAVNSACGYLAVSFRPAAETGLSGVTAWSSTTSVNVPLLDQGVPQEELVGSYQVLVELRTPSHEVALDTSGQPVALAFALTLRLPGECGGEQPSVPDGGSSEDAAGDAGADEVSPRDGDNETAEAGADDAPTGDGGDESASEQGLGDATGE